MLISTQHMLPLLGEQPQRVGQAIAILWLLLRQHQRSGWPGIAFIVDGAHSWFHCLYEALATLQCARKASYTCSTSDMGEFPVKLCWAGFM